MHARGAIGPTLGGNWCGKTTERIDLVLAGARPRLHGSTRLPRHALVEPRAMRPAWLAARARTAWLAQITTAIVNRNARTLPYDRAAITGARGRVVRHLHGTSLPCATVAATLTWILTFDRTHDWHMIASIFEPVRYCGRQYGRAAMPASRSSPNSWTSIWTWKAPGAPHAHSGRGGSTVSLVSLTGVRLKASPEVPPASASERSVARQVPDQRPARAWR